MVGRRRGCGRVAGVAQVSEAAEAVLQVVEAIPPGRVLSYGDVAALAGTGPRQVGQVLSQWGGPVPWWRVVRADGRPAPHKAGPALELLRAEGVPLRGDRVDMPRARWEGPGASG